VASKSSYLRVLERIDQTHDSTVRSKCSRDQRSEEENDVPSVEEETLAIPSKDSLDTAIVASNNASVRVKTFSILHCVELDLESKEKEGREGVGELENAERGDERCQAEEVRDRCGDNECDGPVHWNERSPDDLASSCRQGRSAKEIGKKTLL